MKKSNKKQSIPKGVYGGEASGANPMEWTLRSTILAQLRQLGWHCECDQFSDKSASWIQVYKENPKTKKEGKLYSFSIQFNYEGSIITDVRFFEQPVYTQLGETSIFKF